MCNIINKLQKNTSIRHVQVKYGHGEAPDTLKDCWTTNIYNVMYFPFSVPAGRTLPWGLHNGNAFLWKLTPGNVCRCPTCVPGFQWKHSGGSCLTQVGQRLLAHRVWYICSSGFTNLAKTNRNIRCHLFVCSYMLQRTMLWLTRRITFSTCC